MAAYRRGQHVDDQLARQRAAGPDGAELMTRRHLFLGADRIPAEIHIDAVESVAGDRSLAHQSQRRVLHTEFQGRFQLIERVSGGGMPDPCRNGVFQIAALGEADALVPPQARLVKIRDFGQRVMGSGMGVACEVAQRLEAAVHTGARRISQDLHQFGQGCDKVLLEVGAQRLGGIGVGEHGNHADIV